MINVDMYYRFLCSAKILCVFVHCVTLCLQFLNAKILCVFVHFYQTYCWPELISLVGQTCFSSWLIFFTRLSGLFCLLDLPSLIGQKYFPSLHSSLHLLSQYFFIYSLLCNLKILHVFVHCIKLCLQIFEL